MLVIGANAALATDFSHVRPVLTTMKQNPHDTVIMRGLRVLENMSFGSPDVRKLQQDEGAVEYITSLLSHPKDEIKHQAEVTVRAISYLFFLLFALMIFDAKHSKQYIRVRHVESSVYILAYSSLLIDM